MFFYKNKPIFVVPKEFSIRDMEFNVYDDIGNLIGTNFEGILQNTYYTEQERYELEELIQDIALELEVNIKFAKQYGVKLKDWKTLNIPKEVIINSMSREWNITEKIMNRYLMD